MRRSDAGFTLLEVMAAVAFVAIVFTTLARVANQGLQSEGISKRRLEASLLADEVLSDIEAQVSSGTAPEIGREESEEGIFDVVIDVTTFDLESVIAASAEAPDGDPSFDRSAEDATTESPVRLIEITVTWNEGENEFRVIRTTFGFDLAATYQTLENRGEGVLPPGPWDLTR